MITYLINFPQPSVSFSKEVVASNLRSSITNGLTEQVARFSTSLESFSATWEVSKEQLLIFENWYNTTLAGGVLVFGLMLPDDGAFSIQPVRFVAGTYQVSHRAGLWFVISANFEKLKVTNSSVTRTPAIPQFLRLSVNPAESQNLTKAHFNASLAVKPLLGSQTTLRIYPPTSPAQYILFGLNNLGSGETLITSINVDPLPTPPIVDWPLPLPNVNNVVGQNSKRQTTRIEMDSGHVRQYAGADTTISTYNVEWEFTLAQLAIFQDLFYVSLKAGEFAMSLKLPVDGGFIPTVVRFVGGKFSESYFGKNMFKVSATLDRVVPQTVIPSTENSYPVYYSPTVNVTANRAIVAGDAGKLFVVNPAQGQTISLHIYALNIEFGLLVIGLGNVLVTRGGFVVSASGSDSAGSSYLKPSFQLGVSVLEIGSLEKDTAASSYTKPTFQLVSVVVNQGNLEKDTTTSSYIKPSFEIKTVQVDLATLISDTANSSYIKPIFELIVA